MEKGQVISVVSGKGGTGKTLFAANMGAILALENKKVVLVDLDLGLRNLDLYLGLENKVVFNIMDVISGMCNIKRALIKDKRFENLSLLAASPSGDYRDVTPLHIEVLCKRLKNDFDYVIIDSPAGASDNLFLSTALADKVVIVSEPEVASIRDAEAVREQLVELGVNDVSCVINKVKSELVTLGLVPNIDEVIKDIKIPMAGFIQYDDNLLLSATKGVPFVLKPNTYIEKNLRNIVCRIVNGEYRI